MKLFTGYEPDAEREARSLETGIVIPGDSLTVQADARDADINVIMERYHRTGQLPGLARLPSYGDFDGISDFREALHAVRDAEDLFMQLPAKVRSRFENDAVQFVEFCEKPENRLELAEMGLLAPEVARAIREEAEVKENPTDGSEVVAAASESGGARSAGSKRSKKSADDSGTA